MQTSLFEREVDNLDKMRPLRPRQDTALTDVREAIRQGHRRIILQAPTGWGKTQWACHVIAAALRRGSKPLFTAPAISLIDQTYAAFQREGIHDIGVMQAQHVHTNRNASVQIASVQTLIRRAAPEVDFALIDECFPAGTKVDTPNGPMPIEAVEAGNAVLNAMGIGMVQSVFSKQVNKLVKVRLSDGSHFRCTADHPVFTAYGWKEAGKLDVGQRLFSQENVRALWGGFWPTDNRPPEIWGSSRTGISMEREAVLRSLLSSESGESGQGRAFPGGQDLRGVRRGFSSQECRTEEVSGAEVLRQFMRKEGGEPNAARGSARRGIGDPPTEGAQAIGTGGQREANAGDSADGFGSAGRRMAARVGGQDASKAANVPALLQARLGEPGTDGRDRTGWGKPHVKREKRTGREEGLPASYAWVETVETEELGSPELVYNLRVSGHPSYFANGFLVHNCHELWDGLDALLDSEEWKNKVVIGLSATPWAKGMGLRWTKLVIAGTINDMIAEGHATPAIIYGPEKDVDRGALKVARGEFEEAGAAAAMSDKAIIGDVLKEWQEKSPREKTFAFCVNRDHAKAQMEAFLDAGIPFGYIDAYAPSGERDNERGTRKHAFAQMRYGEIAGIASVGCLIRGVDEDVRCILDLQPTKSEIRHVQKWGRGVRCADGKVVLVGLDHAGNNSEKGLGLFTDVYHDHLDVRKPGDRGEAYKEDYKPAKPRKCTKCNCLIPPGARKCPSCQERYALNPGVTVIDGRLVEMGSGPKVNTKERQDWYSGLLWIARKQRMRDGFAAFSYKEKFGEWPKNLRVRAKQPSDAVKEFVAQRRKEYLASRPKPEHAEEERTA